MKKVISISAILLLAAAVGLAQQQYPSTPGAPGEGQSIIRGCLSGSAGNFTLTQEQTGSIFKLSGREDVLKQHANHLVQINGHQDQSNASTNTSSDNSGAASSQPTFIVSDVQMVADNCNSASSSGSASAAPASSDQSTASSASAQPATDQSASASTSPAQPAADQSAASASTSTASSTDQSAVASPDQSAAAQPSTSAPAAGTSSTDMNNQ